MSIIKLRHFGSFLQDMIPNVVCVHFLLGWVNFGISMNHQIAFGLFPQNFLVYVRDDLTLCNRDILSTFPGVPLRVRQPICGFKAVKQRCTRGYKRYKETSGLIEWKECQIFHSIFT